MGLAAKIRTLRELTELRQTWADQHKTVVWTNGCFDLMHAGHAHSLEAAKELGDILIVGLNSDASVRTIKGDLRPIVGERDRAEMVAALEAVDYVTIFTEPDPVRVLSLLRPDIHCKGAEYAGGARPIPERDTVLSYGGQIRFLPLVPGLSTTSLIERVRRVTVEEAPCR